MKRKKSPQNSQRKLENNIGVIGFIFSCKHDLTQGEKEAYKIIDENEANNVQGEKEEKEEKIMDQQKKLEMELSLLKKNKLKLLTTGCKGIVFVQSKDQTENTSNIAKEIIKKSINGENSNIKHVSRIIPVNVTCETNMTSIKENIKSNSFKNLI
jgi:hypothetical protein